MPSKKILKKPLAKKQTAAKSAIAAKRPVRIAAPAKKSATPVRAQTPAERAMPAADGSRFTLYVYWIIILFFVSATFYILGRSYSIIHQKPVQEVAGASLVNMAGMTQQQRDNMHAEFSANGKRKLLEGNATGAILDLTVAIEANPNVADTFVYRGEAYMQVADYTRAMADFDRAIELDPRHVVAHYDRAMLNMRLENLEPALIDLNIALESNLARPSDILGNHDIYSRRAQLLLWERQFQAAVNDYTAAINASGNNPRPDDFAGRAEAWTGLSEFRHATQDYLSAIALISEKIQDVDTVEERERMSRAAMSYFEKSAALNVTMGDLESARVDLEAAHTLAAALGDNDTASRIQSLIFDL